jgi:transcriptional regulator EpsA
MDTEVNTYFIESVFSALENAYNIKKHVEFFTWLQNDVAAFIPHQMLLAVWGNFNHQGTEHKPLHYDLASGIDGINTRQFIGTTKEANKCMTHLHHLWLANNRRWFALNYFSNTEFDFEFRKIFQDLTLGTHSLLVYGVSDLRGGNDCLYIFFSEQEKVQVHDTVIQCLMPHIDHILRKIQHLDYVEHIGEPEFKFNMLRLTERELEVIDWIKRGKSNQEIAVILEVSVNTIKSHIKRIFQKLNVSKRAQAVALLSSH